MAVLRILAGRALLHKLPYYMAIPAGATAGAIAGYSASMPTAGPRRIALMVAAFLAIIVLGLLAPAPHRSARERAAEGPDSGNSGNSNAPSPTAPTGNLASATPNDSLCD